MSSLRARLGEHKQYTSEGDPLSKPVEILTVHESCKSAVLRSADVVLRFRGSISFVRFLVARPLLTRE
jgi:hypothetical protein